MRSVLLFSTLALLYSWAAASFFPEGATVRYFQSKAASLPTVLFAGTDR